ncbi:mitochondrial matrix Mmp37 [Polychaeton citri CBS 116435]|uniref:Phosphatidate cytidylyltransferase, mitochondrial n=1 Tax=Polychaeton citri CBS 116435 TaxID=1314669 RepID=A0A9P4Q869_9PEZI|nr:mitochondrial matrix Mmp37 [Polychaeton citri CBS 116435]
MLLRKLTSTPAALSLVGAHSFIAGQAAWQYRPSSLRPARRKLHISPPRYEQNQQQPSSSQTTSAASPSSSSTSAASSSTEHTTSKPSSTASSTNLSDSSQTLPPGWEDDPDFSIRTFSQLPHRFFGYNQHIRINEDFKEALRQILWQFKAPIRYAFAYGSGVFSQKPSDKGGLDTDYSPHPNPPKAVEEWQKGGAKIIDFIFGVSHSQHWHSLNLGQHSDHYSGLKYLPYKSAAISGIQDKFGAGVYFNPYITVNGVMIKYGVVNLDTLCTDLTDWSTLYLAGRLQKPVKILRDDPRVRLANQVNLISALRTALLMLPETFTERQLYEQIAGLSYLGDLRMNSYIGGENPQKISNIVGAQLPSFRQLYVPLIENLPNVNFNDHRTPHELAWEKEDAIRHTGASPDLHDVLGGENGLNLQQDLDPVRRGNMVRRLPRQFRKKLYYQYKKKFGIPGSAFDNIMERAQDEDDASDHAIGGAFRRREGGDFERRIAQQGDLPEMMGKAVKGTVSWPSTSQTVKSVFTAGVGRSLRYYGEKRAKSREKPAAKVNEKKEESPKYDAAKDKQQ